VNPARLIVRNTLRSPRRTVLTGAGIGLAVFVVTAVSSVQAGFGSLASGGNELVLDVYEKHVACALGSRVFDSYLGGIRSLPSVEGATGVLRGVYTYQNRQNLVAVEGVDFEEFRDIGEITVDGDGESAFLAAGDGALVGRRLAQQHRWRVGDTVAMVEGLTVRVTGIFSSSSAAYEREILVHKRYLGEVMRDQGKSTYLAVKLSDAAAIAPVSRSIDEAFANYPRPTKTQSEKASREQQARDYDAIRAMLAALVLATIIASLFGAANSVSMSVRERTREVGILRSLGFRRVHVLSILLGESVLTALLGGLLGLGAAWLLLSSEKLLSGLVPVVLTLPTAMFGLGMALLVGLLGGLVPAVTASRAAIVNTLRIVD